MFEITTETARQYLREIRRTTLAEPAEVRELAGGVSNVVLLVTGHGGEPFVVKQARGRLRVKEEWLCPVERIWREVEVLRICGEVLGIQNSELRMQKEISASVPQVLWEDGENFLYAMTAAPAGHQTWKELLLAAFKPEAPVKESPSLALQASVCGELLAALHGGTWNDAAIAAQLDDRSFFDRLRLDPYYRQVARVHPDLAGPISGLIDSVWQHCRCLVHGDFSPKNLLVWPGHLMLIDFEVGHYGDPAFDLGFFLTHLVLKSIWAGPRRDELLRLADQFWTAYAATLASHIAASELADLERRMLLNLAGCLLARIDGKSPVDYLNESQQEIVRRLGCRWLMQPPGDWHSARQALLHSGSQWAGGS